ncbi:Biotin synthesis protein bioK [Prochlorococcus marinus str. SS51]|nr:Biotin synthesis protein bioK [Prochlorococcus marinus str. SS2]KGG24086.1 Biotin synthesis protein bioK [Prochlorococcus marinus str. SS35]KGG31655.1 Biotin synthesis protein bioK [Prochlorococcus marinus str. SS51]
MHGWCSDSSYWNNWHNHFKSKGWLWRNAERGYGHIETYEPSWQESSLYGHSSKKILFCHSLGLHLISRQVLEKASEIVLLNSFSRFIPNSKERRAVLTALNGMQKHIGKDTEKIMLSKFFQKATSPYNKPLLFHDLLKGGISVTGRKQLKEDLDLLINTNKLPDGLNKHAKVLVINSEKDEILCTTTSTSLIDDLNQHLLTPSVNWKIKNEGHFIRLKILIEKVNNWLISG